MLHHSRTQRIQQSTRATAVMPSGGPLTLIPSVHVPLHTHILGEAYVQNIHGLRGKLMHNATNRLKQPCLCRHAIPELPSSPACSNATNAYNYNQPTRDL